MYINLNFDANCFASFHKQCNNSNNSKGTPFEIFTCKKSERRVSRVYYKLSFAFQHGSSWGVTKGVCILGFLLQMEGNAFQRS